MLYDRVGAAAHDTGWPGGRLSIFDVSIPLDDGKVVYFGVSQNRKPPPVDTLGVYLSLLVEADTFKSSESGSVFLVTCSEFKQMRVWHATVSKEGDVTILRAYQQLLDILIEFDYDDGDPL